MGKPFRIRAKEKNGGMMELRATEQRAGAVECLGQTFPSDDARREHFLKLLAETLKDPEFRNQEGFTRATDEAILAMSDLRSPYYTACPNPWSGNFVACYGKPYDPSEGYPPGAAGGRSVAWSNNRCSERGDH